VLNTKLISRYSCMKIGHYNHTLWRFNISISNLDFIKYFLKKR
jgi:hypothetical protein